MQKDIMIAAIGAINADLIVYKSIAEQRANYAYGSKFEFNLGGKSLNVALTASTLSSDVVLIARVGNDILGIDILKKLTERGIITDYIKIDKASHTGVGHVRVDENGQYDTIVVNGANWNLDETDIERFIADGYHPKYVVFNFETDVNLLKRLIPKFKKLQSKIVVNFSPIVDNMREILPSVDIAVLNLAEAQQILNCDISDPKILLQDLHKLGAQVVVITLGSEGAATIGGDGSLIVIPAQKAVIKNTIGAGDGFLAALVYSIASGLDISQSIINATHVGKLICSKQDASLEKEDIFILNSESTFIRNVDKSLYMKG